MDSLVVTHPTTNIPACGLSTAERTGSPVFHTLWSHVLGEDLFIIIMTIFQVILFLLRDMVLECAAQQGS
jgi:hypothetical protein